DARPYDGGGRRRRVHRVHHGDRARRDSAHRPPAGPGSGVRSRLRPQYRTHGSRGAHGDVQFLRLRRQQRRAHRTRVRRMTRAPGSIRAALATLGLVWAVGANAQTGEDRWTFSLTPYLWLPNVNGTLKYSVPPGAAGSPEVSTGPNNYLQNLQSVLMLAGEARR